MPDCAADRSGYDDTRTDILDAEQIGFEHRGRAMGIWTAAFFLAQSQSPRLVHAIDAQMGSMQGAFLTAGLVGLGGAMVALLIWTGQRRTV